MPDFLSEGWFEAFAAALKRLPAEEAAADGLADGLALGQIITEVPDDAGAAGVENGEVRFTIVLQQNGSASLVRDSTEPADVILVEDWSTADAIYQFTHESVASSKSDRSRVPTSRHTTVCMPKTSSGPIGLDFCCRDTDDEDGAWHSPSSTLPSSVRSNWFGSRGVSNRTSPSKSSCFATRLRSCEDRWCVRHCGPWIEQSSLD